MNATPPIFVNLPANGTTVKSLHRVVIFHRFDHARNVPLGHHDHLLFTAAKGRNVRERLRFPRRDATRHDATRHHVLYLNLRLFDPFFKRNENRTNLSIAAYPMFHGNLIIFLDSFYFPLRFRSTLSYRITRRNPISILSQLRSSPIF